MANGFGPGIGGLFEGLGSGFLQGAQLGLQAQHLQLLRAAQEKQDSLAAFKTIGDIANIYLEKPAFGEFLLKGVLPQIGIQRGSDQERNFLGLFKKASETELEDIQNFTETMGLKGIPARSLGFLAKNPAALLDIIKTHRMEESLNQLGVSLQAPGPGLAMAPGPMEIPTEGKLSQDIPPEGSLFSPQAAPLGAGGGTAPLPIEQRITNILNAGQRATINQDEGVRAVGAGLFNYARTLLQTPEGQKALEENKLVPPEDLKRFPGLKAGATFKDIAGLVPRSTEEEAGAAEFSRKLAEQKAALLAPLGEKATQFFDPLTGKQVDASVSFSEAMKLGAIPVTQANLEASAAVRTALPLLDEYSELSKKLLVKDTGSLAKNAYDILKNKAVLFGKRRGGDVDAQRLDALGGLLIEAARAIGTTGRVNFQEIKLLSHSIPGEGDTKESAEAKIDQFRRILFGSLRAKGLPVGTDVSRTTVPAAGSGGQLPLDAVRSLSQLISSNQITKTSEAVDFLIKNSGMTREAAIGFVREILRNAP